MMDLKNVGYKNLVGFRDELEKAIAAGEPYNLLLSAVVKEINLRRFAIVVVVGRKVLVELARWGSQADCEEFAKKNGWPLNTDISIDDGKGVKATIGIRQLLE